MAESTSIPTLTLDPNGTQAAAQAAALEEEIKAAQADYGRYSAREQELLHEIVALSSRSFDAKASMDSINAILRTTGFEGF